MRSSFFIFLFSLNSYAALDLETFCVTPPQEMTEVRDSLSFLLIKDEKIMVRQKDNCIDVVTTPDRVKLLEKFLRKRYNLIREEAQLPEVDLNESQCRLELTTKRTNKSEEDILRSGKMGKITTAKNSFQGISVSKLLLTSGKSGSLEIGDQSLWVECRKGAKGIYQLIFSYSEKEKMRVSSEVSLRANEPLSIAQINNDLNQKNRTLGLAEISFVESNSKENIEYELEVK